MIAAPKDWTDEDVEEFRRRWMEATQNNFRAMRQAFFNLSGRMNEAREQTQRVFSAIAMSPEIREASRRKANARRRYLRRAARVQGKDPYKIK